MHRRICIAIACSLVFGRAGKAQERGAAALGELVSGLSVSGRVLVIAAHPDDEDNQLIAWLATGRHVETAYLSLTRGDGGQNLIGNELGQSLGAIRTEELLAARRIDGGRQFFSRAYDFGFSKSAAESFAQWPHDSVLQDVVTVVRAFRPHVIVAIFTGTPRDGHGQHQVSGIVAREAYDLAGDTVRFPRAATAGLGPWTVQKFYRRARGEPPTLSIDVGEYDPLLGRSYGEIADDAHSQHKSQATGSLQRKGARTDGLRLEEARSGMPANGLIERSIFDGVDTTWARFRTTVRTSSGRAALDSLPAAFAAARERFDAFAPEKLLPAMARISRLLDAVCGAPAGASAALCQDPAAMPGTRVTIDSDLATSVAVARARLSQALSIAAGVAVEATASREVWGVGEQVPVSVEIYDRGQLPVQIGDVGATIGRHALAAEHPTWTTLGPDSTWTRRLTTDAMSDTSQPWWLVQPRQGSMFTPEVRGVEESSRPAAAGVRVELAVDSAPLTLWVPVVYRHADPVRGEMDRPVAGAPAITLLLDHEVEYAPANTNFQRTIRVHLTSAASASRDVDVTLRLPNGLQADTVVRHLTLPTPGSERTVAFVVHGRLPVGRHHLQAVATSNGETFTDGYTAIEYDHIRTQRLYRPSTLELEAVDLALPANLHIAYIAGVGDNVAPTLEQLGINVTLLDPAQLSRTDLSKFSAIVVGTRAYEANASLVAGNPILLDYVKGGGTAVVQYGQYEMPSLLPYPITLARPADRVTVEDAPVRIVDPASPVLTTPNRITTADFTGWQQDLTLYMPRTFDPKYAAMLEVNDPGEPPNKGAILVAPYGKGTFVYTTLAFFRQLPNGVPGAARLFVNLLAAKADRVVQ